MKTRTISILAGVLILVVGTFLPWMQGTGPSLNGFASELGTPGAWVLAIALLRLALLAFQRKWTGYVEAVLALLLIFFLLDNLKTAWRIEGARFGIGLLFLALGTALSFFPRRGRIG